MTVRRYWKIKGEICFLANLLVLGPRRFFVQRQGLQCCCCSSENSSFNSVSERIWERIFIMYRKTDFQSHLTPYELTLYKSVGYTLE